MTVVPLPLHVLYHLLPGLYQPRYFPRRLGFFDSSQSLVFGIKEYITDLPPLLVYNGIFESREDFWFALGLILIANYLPCEVRSVGTEVPFFTGEVIPNFDNCDELAKYYFALRVKIVASLEHQIILGCDFLRQNKVVIDYSSGIISIQDDLVRLSLLSNSKKQNCVTTTSSTCIPAYTEALVEVICPKRYNNKCVLLEPIPTFQFRLFAMARSLSYCDNGKSVCKVFNYSPKTLVLRKGIQIASAVSSNVISSLTPFRADNEPLKNKIEDKQSSETLESFALDYGFKINPELTSLQRFELLQLLFEYKDVFARSLAEIK